MFRAAKRIFGKTLYNDKRRLFSEILTKNVDEFLDVLPRRIENLKTEEEQIPVRIDVIFNPHFAKVVSKLYLFSMNSRKTESGDYCAVVRTIFYVLQ